MRALRGVEFLSVMYGPGGFERFQLQPLAIMPRRLGRLLHVLSIVALISTAIELIVDFDVTDLVPLVLELLVVVFLTLTTNWASDPNKNFVELRQKALRLCLHTFPRNIVRDFDYSTIGRVVPEALHVGGRYRLLPAQYRREHPDLVLANWHWIPWISPWPFRVLHLYVVDPNGFVARLRDLISIAERTADTA